MNPSNFQTATVLDNIKDIDERYPGSMKDAGIIAMLSSLITLQSPSSFDPNSIYSIVEYIDEMLPGSMKRAAIVYLLSQLSAGTSVIESGVDSLSGGTKTIYSSNASSNNPIILTSYASGTASILVCNSIVDGVSFTINSSNPSDTSKVAWAILKP